MGKGDGRQETSGSGKLQWAASCGWAAVGGSQMGGTLRMGGSGWVADVWRVARRREAVRSRWAVTRYSRQWRQWAAAQRRRRRWVVFGGRQRAVKTGGRRRVAGVLWTWWGAARSRGAVAQCSWVQLAAAGWVLRQAAGGETLRTGGSALREAEGRGQGGK